AVDVVLAPSWVEAHPAEVREAARLGVPCIGTDRAGAGVLVPPGDVASLTRQLRAVRGAVSAP
ncbi:MAG: hypothetical protein R3F59_37530, partial [Myxococcota bacterium]